MANPTGRDQHIYIVYITVDIIVGIVVFAIWLLNLDLATTYVFVFICSQLVVVAFIFGNTLKMIFEAIIFLFVIHPFDVGDRCEIEGVQMFVEEMTISIEVQTWEMQWISVSMLQLQWREKLAIMKEKIIGFIESRKEHWHPGPSVVLRDVDDMNRLKIPIWLRHRINYQDMGERLWCRR
ncbi:hypothetical protein J5N97_023840 [Dioscorea zingiberensis]|uniref:Uncharacterized protein n=1 Tax=Dioscorea zingiberensis TaxID=325984 RepID=A0A9D5C5V5_9LILI|nr:hypothetical protein J5N97_023840 [Dioscorea zingiberensis]